MCAQERESERERERKTESALAVQVAAGLNNDSILRVRRGFKVNARLADLRLEVRAAAHERCARDRQTLQDHAQAITEAATEAAPEAAATEPSRRKAPPKPEIRKLRGATLLLRHHRDGVEVDPNAEVERS